METDGNVDRELYSEYMELKHEVKLIKEKSKLSLNSNTDPDLSSICTKLSKFINLYKDQLWTKDWFKYANI